MAVPSSSTNRKVEACEVAPLNLTVKSAVAPSCTIGSVTDKMLGGGTGVGNMVGANVGVVVGNGVGAVVGNPGGAVVGGDVGAVVGDGVGAEGSGAVVGSVVGAVVGAEVGVLLGIVVGEGALATKGVVAAGSLPPHPPIINNIRITIPTNLVARIFLTLK